jgi:hypothetical protein
MDDVVDGADTALESLYARIGAALELFRPNQSTFCLPTAAAHEVKEW